jgi:ABC-type lipoprotein export system ATPase subunit
MKIIEINNLKKIYNDGEVETPAVIGVSFSINKGEFLAIMGPSGSGKSTLLHILGLLDRQSEGDYFFEGEDVRNFSGEKLAKIRNKKMGFIFQSYNLLPRTTVLDNVKLPLCYSDIKESKWDSIAKEAIESVGLSHRINHDPSQLSGGEKQRVAIARALVNNPDVIFADEPTGNLDSKSGKIVMEILQKLSEEMGHTVILITHETYTAEHAERIIHIIDGKIDSDKPVGNRHKAKEDFTK